MKTTAPARCDPFNPAYQAWLSDHVAPRIAADDPNLVMYFLGNEIGIFDHPGHLSPGVRDLRGFYWSQCPASSTIDAPECTPHALARFLRDRYTTVDAWNAAWGRSYTSFMDVVDAKPSAASEDPTRRCRGTCEDDLQRFHREFLREWIEVTTSTVRALDPNHLVASPRLAANNHANYCWWGVEGCNAAYTDGRSVPDDHGDVVYSPFGLFGREGDAGYDLVAINVYSRPHWELERDAPTRWTGADGARTLD